MDVDSYDLEYVCASFCYSIGFSVSSSSSNVLFRDSGSSSTHSVVPIDLVLGQCRIAILR